MTRIALLAAAGIAAHLVFLNATPLASFAEWPLFAVLLLGGTPLVWGLARKLAAREFGSDLLAGLSIVTAVILGQYLVAAIVVLMLSGGEALEQYATRRASSLLEALERRTPRLAHRLEGAQAVDIPVDGIRPGDRLLVRPHEVCPVDGTVVDGHGSMDESYLTGEPYDMSKAPGSTVLSGALNGESALTIEATRLAGESRYAQILQVLRTSEENKPRLRRVGDRLGAWYTPLALALAGAGWLLSGDPSRFLAVLVVATPCPLLIAIPVAVIGAISLAAKRGIVIRNAAVLEQVTTCRTVIFDKTGTLTYGRPSLTSVHCADGWEEAEVLLVAASVEQYSKHPLAAAIVEAARARGLALLPAASVTERPGEGIWGQIEGRRVRVGGRAGDTTLPPPGEGLECVVRIEDRWAALLRFRDTPRLEARSFVDHLRPIHGIDRVMLVSGDRESEVLYLARIAGISEVVAGASPEEKLAIVRRETARARTLFVGDGLNDAPALTAATAGVAFGHASDITSEAADAVVLTPSLEKVDELLHISRHMRTVALQSAVGGMALSAAGMLLAALGWLPPLAGAIAQEGIDLLAVLNALRATRGSEASSDFPMRSAPPEAK